MARFCVFLCIIAVVATDWCEQSIVDLYVFPCNMEMKPDEDCTTPKIVDAVATIDRAFKEQGWVLVSLRYHHIPDPSLNSRMYDLALNDKHAQQYSYTVPGTSTVLGYEHIGGRSVYRLRTGKYIGETIGSVRARTFRDNIIPMAMDLDDMLWDVSSWLVPLLWKTSAHALAVEHDIPFLMGRGAEHDAYALFRAAFYTPAARSADEHLAVMAHYDPGFLSIGIWQSAAGLQFLDADGRWMEMPVGNQQIGIMWLGKAGAVASKGRYKAALHRVGAVGDGGRLAVWSEICTREQVFRASTDDAPTNVQPESEEAKQALADWRERVRTGVVPDVQWFIGAGTSS